MNDKPKVIDFQHKFHLTPFTRVPMCDSPVGYIVLRDNTFEIICASGHVAVWRRFETNDIARQIAKATSDIYHVSLLDESEGEA